MSELERESQAKGWLENILFTGQLEGKKAPKEESKG